MSRDRVSAVGLPDPSVAVWRAETVATEAGPRAGLPVSSSASLLALTTSGPQTETIEVQTARGGRPVRDAAGTAAGVIQAAGVLWRPDGGTWRGWDPPRTMSRWEPVNVQPGGVGYAIDPDVVVLDSGVVLVACEVKEDSASGPWRLACMRRVAGSSTWTTISIESFTTDPGYSFRPTIVRLPTGRLHVYRYLVRSASYSGLRWWYSDDDGLTWTWGGDGATDATLRDDSGNGPTRMRARYNSGQVLLLARLADIGGAVVLRQFASADLGNHFQFVHDAKSADAAFTAAPGVSFDVAPSYVGGFAVAVQSLVTSGSANVITLPSAFRRLDQGESQQISATAVRVAVAADESGGLLYLVGLATDATEAYGSFDGGTTWAEYEPGTSGDATWYPGGIDITIDWALALGRGRGHLAHRWSTSSYSWGAALGMAYFGGWANPTQPLARQSDSDFDSIGWYETIVPAAPPDDYDNVSAVSVTATVSYLSAATTAVATLGQNAHYRFDLASVSAANALVYARLVGRVSSGSTLTAMRAGMLLVVEDPTGGTDKGILQIRMESGAWRLWDAQAGAQIGADVTHATGADVEIWVMVDAVDEEVKTFWRLRTDDEDRIFAAGPAGGYTAAASPLTERIDFGILNTDTTATTMRIAEVSFAPGITTYAARIATPVTTTTLASRLVAGRPYLGAGVYLQARQGPTWRGETWTIRPSPDMGLDRAVLDPSPRNLWRSTSTAQQQIAISWDAQRSPVLALALRGSNIPEVEIETWNGLSWDALGTATLSTSLPFVRSGLQVRPNAAGSGYLSHGETVGGWVSLSATNGKAITHQTEGLWSTGAQPRARIVISDDGGAPPSAGTGRLVWPDALILLDLGDLDTTAIRLTVPAAASSLAPPESYWQIGSIACRWLWPLGSEHAWGEVEETVTHVEGDRTRDQLWRGVQVAPASRRASVEFSVVSESGVDTTPQAVRAGSAHVAEQGTARALAGYLREVEGAAGSVLYVPDVPGGDLGGSVSVLLGRRRFLLGRMIAGGMTTRQREGSERGDLVVDAGQIVFEEDP